MLTDTSLLRRGGNQNEMQAPEFEPADAPGLNHGFAEESDLPQRLKASPLEPKKLQSLQSCLYVGTIAHRRLRPVEHRFQYKLFMAMIDLDEVDQLFGRGRFCSFRRFSPIQFRRSDFLGDASRPLADCVRELVRNATGRTPRGPIRLLTHLRYFGFTFNPVSLYYCYGEDSQAVQAILADVTNTPWGERHTYVIPCDETGTVRKHCCPKAFHVSPFMPMEQTYRWTTSAPTESLAVSVESSDVAGNIFAAHLNLQRRSFSEARLAWLLVRFPLITLKVVAAIYWQALRLWWKRVPFVPHPNRISEKESNANSL